MEINSNIIENENIGKIINETLDCNEYEYNQITIITNDECQELKNIKYKTMLLNGTPLKETKHSSSLKNLDKFLEQEKTISTNETWSKLNKTLKTQKLIEFSYYYQNENELDDDETKLLIDFFKDCLLRKKLQRVKDVVIDKSTGQIKSIPALVYNKNTRHFTLKNIDKRVSTLKSLAIPKKNLHNTIKNKGIIIDNVNIT